jgi:DnaJ-class molecular chaperone
MSSKDYYKILGLTKEATEEDIKRAYRTLAMKYHPDKTEEDKDVATEKFKQVAEAYQVLSDPEKRRDYDSGGTIPIHPMFGNPFDLFSQLFGGNHQNSKFAGNYHFKVFNMADMIPEPIIETMVCTIFDIFNGATKELEYTRNVPEPEKAKVTVNVQKGWKDGTRLTYHGHGNKFNVNGKPGDLIVIIKEKYPGPNLIRSDNDIIFIHNISLKAALLGIEFAIINLDNERISIDLRGTVIADGAEKRLIGKGIDGKNKTGDLVIKFKIEYPSQITQEQRELIEKIL